MTFDEDELREIDRALRIADDITGVDPAVVAKVRALIPVKVPDPERAALAWTVEDILRREG